MNKKQLINIAIGLGVIFIAREIYLASTSTPLNEGLEPQNIEPSSISRALDKLKNGDIKVNETPQETKNAVG
jgi:hypothetical protein